MNVSKHTFFTLLLWGCTEEKPQQEDDTTITQRDPNNNGDESLNILILGSEQSITDGVAFSASQIATELESILTSDTSLTYDIQVRAEDIHLSTDVTIGLGGNGAEYTYTHHSHSLLQYYYWPDGMADRHANLKGEGGMVWDHVIIAADPYIVATTPGYYALGVNKISSKVSSGIAEPHLLMIWPQVEYASVSQYKEFIYRTAENAKEPLRVIPAALAWSNLEESQQDSSATHPSPHGAYLTASSIYSHLTGKNAVETGYSYQDDLAEVAFEMMNEAEEQGYDSQSFTFDSPFAPCDVMDEIITYNHTGSSSENGILGGLNWVFERAAESLENGDASGSTFNFGRANSNFEANKRYKINPDLFSYSFGFPMQDHGNHGDTSMLYGLDRRDSGVLNDTDLGVARFMIEQGELPYARAIPIRTLFAQMREVIPEQSAYRDAWHMHRDLDKAIGAYMYTILTSKGNLGEEPADPSSAEWRTWMAHKIGYETAWTFMYLEGASP